MRVTIPILTLCRGGAQRMLLELANHLVTLGHEVNLVMPLGGVVEYEIRCGIILTGKKNLEAIDFPYADVIVSNYYTTVAPAQEASELGRGVHIRLALCYEPSFLPNNNLSYASYHICKNLMVISRWEQETIRLNHGIKGKIIPVGVGPAFYNQGFRELPWKRVLVSAIVRKPEGGFSGHREQEYLLRQLKWVKEVHPEVDIYLITPPAELSQSVMLQELADDGMFQMRTPGNDEELCFHYNETDIFVSSSTYDSGSLPGLEAMRCGAALVTTYAGGNMEYCVHEHNCLMSYRHENQLGNDVIRLINDRGLRQRLAGNGEQDSQRFNWERSAEVFQKEIYHFLSK
ncbi:glycosyltransferase family 4 protein [Paenibacillus sp. sgz500958]|uniref:glycosyltransferase family 4 protein n=1 Tax=Paenibacillus sp. sgz500958 TaxID=3242475 RepID=UPI0036D22687